MGAEFDICECAFNRFVDYAHVLWQATSDDIVQNFARAPLC